MCPTRVCCRLVWVRPHIVRESLSIRPVPEAPIDGVQDNDVTPSPCSRIYHFDFLCVLALFSLLGHGFCSFFFLEHLERARRYITRRDRGSSDSRGASYRHRKPPKLALFCGVPIPEKLEKAFAFLLFCGAFCTRPCVVCCKHTSNLDCVRPFSCLQQRKSQQTSSQ